MLLNQPPARVLLLDVRDRRADVDLDRALEDVERRRAELPFAADDLARLEVALAPPRPGSAPGTCPTRPRRPAAAGSTRRRACSPSPSSVPTTRLLVSAPVGHDTMHSPHDTHVELPIGSSRSKAMPRRVALAAPADDHVLLDVVAAADAAIAEDAGLVIDGDDQRRVVAAARRQPAREARLAPRRPPAPASRARSRRCAAGGRRATDGRPSASRPACVRACTTPGVVGLTTFMPGSHSRMQDGGIDARADVHDADAADADRRLVLLVAERRDRDAVQPRGVEDRRALAGPRPRGRRS